MVTVHTPPCPDHVLGPEGTVVSEEDAVPALMELRV